MYMVIFVLFYVLQENIMPRKKSRGRPKLEDGGALTYGFSLTAKTKAAIFTYSHDRLKEKASTVLRTWIEKAIIPELEKTHTWNEETQKYIQTVEAE